MTDIETTRTHRIADFLIRHRAWIVGLFALITLLMIYSMTQLKIETGFKKQLPLDHEYMQTFLDYEKEFGGANRILVALVAREGDMFTNEFFESFEEISDQVFFIPGVDRASVRSIFTPNVRFVEIVEDGFAGGNVIPADFAPSPEMFETVRGKDRLVGSSPVLPDAADGTVLAAFAWMALGIGSVWLLHRLASRHGQGLKI